MGAAPHRRPVTRTLRVAQAPAVLCRQLPLPVHLESAQCYLHTLVGLCTVSVCSVQTSNQTVVLTPHEGGGCGGAQPASGSVCPSCCASGARAAALLFLTVRLTHNLPLLGWVFRLRKAFSSSENSDSQTWESPRHQGLALLTGAAWRVSPTAWGPLLYAPPELLFQGLFISGFSQRTEDIRTKQKAEHGKGQGPAASMDRCGFRS